MWAGRPSTTRCTGVTRRRSRLGLVPTLPPHIDAHSLVATMKCDNKKTGNSMRFVLLEALGSCTNKEGDYLVTISDDAYILDGREDVIR